jgi:hypothetical protein
MFHRITIADLNAFEKAIELEEIPFEDEWSEEQAVCFHNKCVRILVDDMACFLEAW